MVIMHGNALRWVHYLNSALPLVVVALGMCLVLIMHLSACLTYHIIFPLPCEQVFGFKQWALIFALIFRGKSGLCKLKVPKVFFFG
jgi:hypothetical protein